METSKIAVGDICTFKLSSGEEVVAKVVENNGDSIVLSEPLSVAPGQKGLGLVTSMFTHSIGNPVTLNTKNVAMFGQTDESVKTSYIEVTTGLQLPNKKVLMG